MTHTSAPADSDPRRNGPRTNAILPPRGDQAGETSSRTRVSVDGFRPFTSIERMASLSEKRIRRPGAQERVDPPPSGVTRRAEPLIEATTSPLSDENASSRESGDHTGVSASRRACVLATRRSGPPVEPTT